MGVSGRGDILYPVKALQGENMQSPIKAFRGENHLTTIKVFHNHVFRACPAARGEVVPADRRGMYVSSNEEKEL